MGGVLSLALSASFLIGNAISSGPYAAYTPFVDLLILVIVAVAMIPFPLITIWRAGRDILQIAPDDLDRDVRQLARTIAEKHGFSDHASHVMRSGRQRFVEIGLVAPSGATRKTFGELDAIRAEIAEAMGGKSPGTWLTVDFTADRRWI